METVRKGNERSQREPIPEKYGNGWNPYRPKVKTQNEIIQEMMMKPGRFNSGGTPHTEEELDRVRNMIVEENKK